MTDAILFVCMGNICRSPTAHGVLQHRIREAGLEHRFSVDSAGTHHYHTGSPPDARSQRHAQRRGYDLSNLRARPLTAQDFDRFDLILVMDGDNLRTVRAMAPAQAQYKIRLFSEFFRTCTAEGVPDPYEGGEAGFEHVLDLVEDGCEGLIEHLRKETQ